MGMEALADFKIIRATINFGAVITTIDFLVVGTEHSTSFIITIATKTIFR